jgi:hypothetical protein
MTTERHDVLSIAEVIDSQRAVDAADRLLRVVTHKGETMSSVTNVILSFVDLKDLKDGETLPIVNKFFDGRPGLVAVNDPSLPKYWYGGGKVLECDLAIGAFNYLEFDEFVDYLKTLDWDTRHGAVQLIYMKPERPFEIIEIRGEDE